MSAADVCRKILDENGLYHIRIERVAGNLTDHYDPRAGVIRLSDSVFNSASVASIGVAAHEAGHAVQYAEATCRSRFETPLFQSANLAPRFRCRCF